MESNPNSNLESPELLALIRRVFLPRPEEKALAILVDLPDAQIPDNEDWRLRREMSQNWAKKLQEAREELGMETRLVLYPNVHTNNGDLPEQIWLHTGGALPARAEDLEAKAAQSIEKLYAQCPILLAPTEFSATAPLKMAARRFPIRAATMPGFKAEMIPALRLDYQEVNRRVEILKALLDQATGADLSFGTPDGPRQLHLDLRFRSAHASGGVITEPGTAGNLPSGEAYIVPFEGETEPSQSAGELPVQFGEEIVLYRIAGNKAVEVLSQGQESERERGLIQREPAYANLAELGLGVLGAFGIQPVGEVLLDEKLGLHIAFGRSEHFGGQVAPKHFSSPQAVVHIDRVYVPQTQPLIQVLSLDLQFGDGGTQSLMRDGHYVSELF